MALQKQIVQMAVEGGLDTKTDDKNVIPTNFLELENVVFTKTGSFSKRNGYKKLSTKTTAGNTIDSTAAVTTFKDELLSYSNQELYSFSEAAQKWVDKGPTKYALAKEFSVGSDGQSISTPVHAVYLDTAFYAYTSKNLSSGAIRTSYKMIDNITGSVLVEGSIANEQSPRVAVLNGNFILLSQKTGVGPVYRARKISPTAPYTVSAPSDIIACDVADFVTIGDRLYFGAITKNVAPSSDIFIGYIDLAFNITGPVSYSIAGANYYNWITCSQEGTSDVRVTYGGSSTLQSQTVLYNLYLLQVHAPLSLGATVDMNGAAIQSYNSTTQSDIYVSQKPSATLPGSIIRYRVTNTGTLVSTTTIINAMMLQSKLQIIDSKVYAAASPSISATYPITTGFFVNESGELMTIYAIEFFAGVGTAVPQLPPLLIEGTSLAFAGAELAAVAQSSTYETTSTTVKKYSADFQNILNYFDATLGDNLHIAGGVLKMYDGAKVVEHGFLQTPVLTFVSDAAGTGLADGTYAYQAVFAWRDKWGQLHRSNPSAVMSHTVTGGPKDVTFKVSTLGITNKTNVEIEIYRTEANGTTLYKVNQYIANDPTVATITVVDVETNANILRGEIIYTTGGTLENIPANASKHITTYKNRVFLALSDGYTVQYSKLREQNGPVEFNDALKIKVDAFGGPISALGVMDDHIIIFKEQAIYTFSGEGPNNLGEQDDYLAPQLITTDAGCIDTNSVVITPLGLMFKSKKGIYLLERNMGVKYIGAPVEKYNDLTITSSTLMSDTNQVRFTTDSDKALMYDYFHSRWTTFTNINAIDATIYNGVYTYAKATGGVFEETPGLYSDNLAFIQARIVSAWIHMANVQGFERIYKLLLLGNYLSEHKLRVYIAYDYNPAFVHNVEIDVPTILDPNVYGDGSYGEITPYGGEFPLYQWRVFPKIQKCQAFKFLIEDIKTVTNGASFTLSNFAAEVGIKQGLVKKAANKSFGAE